VGKSGLVVDSGEVLQRLIADAQSADRDFDVTLISDVSRRGWFEDNDEDAQYESLARRAGSPLRLSHHEQEPRR
jgi:hypothetical protein